MSRLARLRRATLVATAAALATVLVACGDAGALAPTATPSATPSVAASPSPAPSRTPTATPTPTPTATPTAAPTLDPDALSGPSIPDLPSVGAEPQELEVVGIEVQERFARYDLYVVCGTWMLAAWTDDRNPDDLWVNRRTYELPCAEGGPRAMVAYQIIGRFSRVRGVLEDDTEAPLIIRVPTGQPLPEADAALFRGALDAAFGGAEAFDVAVGEGMMGALRIGEALYPRGGSTVAERSPASAAGLPDIEATGGYDGTATLSPVE